VNTLDQWCKCYELYGFKGLERRASNASYSVELKLRVVDDYLSGEFSTYEIIEKYKIAIRTQLTNWINKYNGHSGLRSYRMEEHTL
jgi:transposase